jgi:tRNA U34 5-carboxymethylaminomethyl modifying GTPase MnmE/TrmE
MSKQRKINVAKALAAQLHATENAIETALGEAAHLLETYISSRRAVRLSTVAVNDVYRATLKAMQSLNLAQARMTNAHNALSRLQGQIGLDVSLVAPIDDKPDPGSPGDNNGVSAQDRAVAVS